MNKADLHREMLERHRTCWDYWKPQYDAAREDVEFAFTPDSQWDDWMRDTRTGRPMYTVNRLRQALKQITNDQRQNRPQAKVRAAEGGDADLAEVRQGIIRGIDSQIDAQRAVDTAFLFAVGGGYGVWRVNTRYADDGGFDQVIEREEIANPYSVVFDQAAKKKDRRDARFAFVDTRWARSAFRARWPDAKLVSVDGATEATKDWWAEDEVTVSEYWYKKAEQVEIVLLSDGSVHDADDLALIVDELAAQGITIQRRRVIERDKVYQCIVSGAEILEGPNEWAGRFIPLVPCWGELINVKGRDQFFGATRFAKDAQRMYNYERSTFIETLADQPYSPFMADAASIEGYEAQYQSLRTRRPPVLLYKSNPGLPNGGKPSREAPPAFPAALAQAAAISADDVKAATGIHDASLGARSNETSGRAILARQREGDVANFDYIDNLSYALKYDFEILNDLITAVYDTERQIRIVGDDGAEQVVAVNRVVVDEQTGQPVTLNDLTQGRYDVSVTVGPSYTTQRMEAAEAMMQLANDPSPIGMVAKYGFIKNLDAPMLEDVREAARKILVGQGLLEPAEGDQPPPPPQPNPKDVAGAEKDAASARKYNAEAEGQEIENQAAAFQFGAQLGALGIAGPPQPPPPAPAPNQPPQGGFFVAGAGAPAAPAPGGFPGQP
ncbi:portal protein [Pseudoxanthomonas jiangsuensis]|uniref:portal protein n=1 Tax=Pseudoxanthomonas jiangsuensis TaxID=619688 RepID=UPI001FE950A4|nr:portal protein [Pseudoxanthomonas jiangsuensis]